MSLEGVCKQRRKFCALGVIEQSARFIANVAAARFQWIANNDANGVTARERIRP